MKTIIVEGKTDAVILQILFPEIGDNHIELRVAMGFSNVISIGKAFIDHGRDVLLVMDTDTNIPGVDNRNIFNRINNNHIGNQLYKIAWLDPNIDVVLSKFDPIINRGLRKISQRELRKILDAKKPEIIESAGFKEICEFIKR